MFKWISLENLIILVLGMVILVQWVVMTTKLFTHYPKVDESLSKDREELVNDNGLEYLRKVAASVSWPIILLTSTAISFIIIGYMLVILYLFKIDIKSKRLLILLLFTYIFIFIISFTCISGLISYYNYHHIGVKYHNN